MWKRLSCHERLETGARRLEIRLFPDLGPGTRHMLKSHRLSSLIHVKQTPGRVANAVADLLHQCRTIGQSRACSAIEALVEPAADVLHQSQANGRSLPVLSAAAQTDRRP
jgi:hypothetical protein